MFNDATPLIAESTPADADEVQLLAIYEQRASVLVPTDDLTVRQCAEFIEECKLAEKRQEQKRKDKVGPLNAEVTAINALYMPVRDAFGLLWRTVDEKVSRYVHEQQQKARLEQQRLIAEAKKKRDEEDAKAEAVRKAADAARQAGDDKLAAKLDARADKAEVKASMITAPIVLAPERTMDLGGHTLSVNAPKKDWIMAGWDKAKPLPVLDASLAPLIGNTESLPEGLRWLLRFCDINPVRLNAAFKSGEKFPVPFAETDKFGGSTLRRG